MAKIDGYLRSIEKLGAAGAVLASGQSVVLRFAAGDRQANQVTSHDALVGLVREVAPPPALDQIDSRRPARFDVESGGTRYTLSVSPKPGAWQVSIEPARAPAAVAVRLSGGAAPGAASEDTDLPIERVPYQVETEATAAPSGSTLLDRLTSTARATRATDVYLATGAPPLMRVAGELQPMSDRGPLDGETLARELGIVAPAEARAAWNDRGLAIFTYGDGAGRVRATLSRDRRGPGAALRLLGGEAPALDRLGIGREIAAWLDQPGLVLVAGASGSGRTTTLAALVRALGERRRRVVAFEDPIEIVHTGHTVSQRALGVHIPALAPGIAAAIREGADAIAVGAVASPEDASSVISAVAAGHLVVAVISAPSVREAMGSLIDMLPPERRDLAREVVEHGLIGSIAPVHRGGARSFDVLAGPGA